MTARELSHHGILGQKWGVRRYQNYDGSYNKEGMKRYRKAESNYNDAKSVYKSAKETGDKEAILKAKASLREAKKDLNRKYDQLEKDKKADKGKELYQKGKTINEIRTKNFITSVSTSAISTLIGVGLDRKGASFVTNYGKEIPISNIVKLVGTGASLAVSVKGTVDSKNLRAYYSHTRK